MKIGDRVRCIKSLSEVDHVFDLEDKIYVVTHVFLNHSETGIKLLGLNATYCESRFEVVKKEIKITYEIL